MVTQLRMYRIKRGKMAEWIWEWREGVHPLRVRFGYKIDGAWTVDGQNAFVWMVSYDGPRTWKDKEAEYYDSAERRNLKPDPSRHIEDQQTWFLSPVSH